MMKDILSLSRFNEITSKFTSIDPIVVVGDVGIDKYTFGEVRRISPEAPVPVLEVTKEWLKLGLAANISHNLNTLGVKSTLCGVVGEDNNANLFDNLLEDEKLNTWGIVRTKSRPTIFKERVTTNTQQICRIDYESSDYIDEETEQKILIRIDEFVKNHQALIIEDYAKGTLTKSLIASLISKFKSNGKLVAVDPGRTTPPLFYKGAFPVRNVTSEVANSTQLASDPNSPSTKYLEKGDFLRLGNLTFGYTFSGGILEKAKIKSARFFVNGQNLLLFTNYSGFDPEVNVNKSFNGVPSMGMDYIAYPKAKTFSVGLNVNF